MTVYAYTRLSRERGDNVSIDVQQNGIRVFCKLRGLPEPVYLTPDINVSGKMPFFDRPGLRGVKFKRGDILISYRYDRMFRNMADGAQTIQDLCDAGIDLIFMNLPAVAINTSTGRMMAHMMIAVAQNEREMIAARTKDGFEQMRAKGIPVMGARFAPPGWSVITENGRRRFEKNLEERKLCVWARHLRERGMLMDEIVAAFQEKGRTWRGRPLSRVAIRRMIEACKDGFPTRTREAICWDKANRAARKAAKRGPQESQRPRPLQLEE